MSSVGGYLYLIGGMTFAPNPKKPGYTSSMTLVDNWKYDPVKQKWTRLADFPIASCNFQTIGPMYVRRTATVCPACHLTCGAWCCVKWIGSYSLLYHAGHHSWTATLFSSAATSTLTSIK